MTIELSGRMFWIALCVVGLLALAGYSYLRLREVDARLGQHDRILEFIWVNTVHVEGAPVVGGSASSEEAGS